MTHTLLAAQGASGAGAQSQERQFPTTPDLGNQLMKVNCVN